MPKYVVTARVVLALTRHVVADDEDQAYEKVEEILKVGASQVHDTDSVEDVEVTSVNTWEPSC